MSISYTAITINGTTAWLVEIPNGLPPLTEMYGSDERPMDRPCDTCDGTGTNRVNVNRSLKGVKGCAPCWCTGRHTFEILTSEVFIAGDGENAIRITALSVHVVEVLEIQNRSPFEIDTIWDREDDTYWWVVETPPQYNEPPEGLPVTLPADAAVGMRAVLMAVHT